MTEMNRIQTHGVNAVLMWIDYLLSAERIYYRSALLPILFSSLYAIWTVVFEFTIGQSPNGDPYIYEPVDWRSGWKAPLQFYGIGLVALVVVTWTAAFIKNFTLKAMERMREVQSPSTGSVVKRFMWNEEDADYFEDPENEQLML